jgi:TP901 family phage tail tape measure protein
MSLSVREVLLIMRAQDEISSVLQHLSSNFGTVDKAAASSAKSQILAGAALTTVGLGMADVGVKTLEAMATATGAAKEFEQGIASVQTQVTTTKVSNQQLGDEIIAVATKTAVPIKDLTSGLFDIFSTIDVNAPQSQTLLQAFAKESVAGQLDLQTAARATMTVMNAYHIPIDNVNHVLDVNFQLHRVGVGTYQQFASVMGQSVPSAVRAGQSYETLAGMMAFLTRNGLSAAGAAAAAGRSLDAFSNPKVVERLQAMGVQILNSKGGFNDMAVVMGQLQEKMAGLTDPQRSAALHDLFLGAGGTIQARRFYDMVTATKNQADAFKGFVGDMNHSAGAFEEAYGQMADTTVNQSQLLENNWQALQITVGQAFLPILNQLIQALMGVLQWWNGLDDGLKQNIVRWVAIGAAIMVVLGAVIMIAGALVTLGGVAALVGIPFIAMLGIFLAIPIAIAAIIAVIVLIVTHWNQVRDVTISVWNAVIDKLKMVYDWIKSQIGDKLAALWKDISSSIKAAWGPIADFIIDIWKKISDWANKIWPDVKKIIDPIVQWFQAIWPYVKEIVSANLKAMADALTFLWDIVKAVFQGIWEVIKGVVTGIWDILSGLIDIIVGVFSGDWERVWHGIGEIFNGFWEIIKGIAIGAWTILKGIFLAGVDFIINIWKDFEQFIHGIWNVIVETAKSLWNSFWEWLKKTFWDGVNFLGDTFKKIEDFCKIPVQWVIDIVYNGGIVPLWNGIAGLFGLGKLNELHLADGGPVYGPGGPRDDMVPAWLSNGEYVMPADKTGRYFGALEAMRAGTYADGGLIGSIGDFFNNAGSWLAGIGSSIADFFSDPVGSVKKMFQGPIDQAQHIANNQWGKALASIPGKVLDGAVKKAEDFAASLFSGGGGDVNSYTGLVAQVLAMLGQPASLIPSVLRRMNQESGGNPNAINLWDSNAQAGMPSQGLMQVIPPTFDAYAGPFRNLGITNPLANIYAGLNYALHSYGSISAAMDQPGGYANGGWLMPGKLGYNETSKPEAVFTQEQLSGLLSNRSQGKTVVQHFYITTQEINPQKHAADLGWELARRR